MKIALVQCPVWGTYDPPLALVQLSACLKQQGHKAYVFDINIKLYLNRRENYKDMWAWEQSLFWYNPSHVSKFFLDNQEIIQEYVEKILNTGSEIVCFSVSSSSRIASLELAKLIKAKRQDVIIIFGGTLFFQRSWIEPVLRQGPVDIVIPGEGELTLCELVKMIERREDLSPCCGIFFRRGYEIINSGERPLIDNLDTLPFLDFSDTPLSDYDDPVHLALMTSRGCIQQCAFCSSRSFWRGYRTMSGERIFREIKSHCERNRTIGHIDFLDLLFNGNMKTLTSFCNLMIESRLGNKVKWSANAIIRPEMTPEVLANMQEAGCEHLIYGIESGSQKVLDLMRKRYRISDAHNVLKATHQAGIMVTANFMFGFPGETEEDFSQTLDFVRKNTEYLDRVYPSRTYCAVEEFSYFHTHLKEFGIEPNPVNHLYWESEDSKNTYPQRLVRCEEFCRLASSLGIEVGCGVQTSVELDRWFNLGHYYEFKKDCVKAVENFLNYYEADSQNEVILNKIEFYYNEIKRRKLKVAVESKLMLRLKKAIGIKEDNDVCAEPKLAEEKEQRQVRFTWNIHYDCNYRCPYCFFDGKWKEYQKRNIYLTPDGWMDYWRRIYEIYGRCYILITGGEPFTYPNFIELIKKLSQMHYPINISTNSSGDLKSFVKLIDPQHVSVSLSFQPEFDKLEDFLERVKLLRENRFDGCINFVAYPPYLKDIAEYREKFKKIGEELKVIPFWGEYQGITYPYGYTPHQKEFLGINEEWFSKVRKKGKPCSAGYNSALVFPDGKVARCGQIGEKELIGNFFDPNFRLLAKPSSCNAEACPCSEDIVWPAEDEEGKNKDVGKFATQQR